MAWRGLAWLCIPWLTKYHSLASLGMFFGAYISTCLSLLAFSLSLLSLWPRLCSFFSAVQQKTLFSTRMALRPLFQVHLHVSVQIVCVTNKLRSVGEVCTGTGYYAFHISVMTASPQGEGENQGGGEAVGEGR